ncbi:UNVERIFIED_CONTAM: hypothetical protein Sradi_4862400 [Sesamum radiatum]|uniref:Secreted protein n=1 Tax=Sesamum radiatum TaxID=300843 RepID=A0AAW2N0T8_SESRA
MAAAAAALFCLTSSPFAIALRAVATCPVPLSTSRLDHVLPHRNNTNRSTTVP